MSMSAIILSITVNGRQDIPVRPQVKPPECQGEEDDDWLSPTALPMIAGSTISRNGVDREHHDRIVMNSSRSRS